MVITLTGNRTVAVRLASRFAPEHIANIRALLAAHWWDGASVYRVQENWVAQWGDATEKKPLPDGVRKLPAAEYDLGTPALAQRLTRSDAYSRFAGVTADGWALVGDDKTAWLPHCYGSVGVARDASPDTGTGAELFTPISGAARRLDRNYTVVGRIIEGMKYLAALPRSDAAMGVYATEGERTGIISVSLASALPPAQRPSFEYRATDNERFAAYLRLRENPAAPMIGLGGIDICDLPLATRRAGAK